MKRLPVEVSKELAREIMELCKSKGLNVGEAKQVLTFTSGLLDWIAEDSKIENEDVYIDKVLF